MRPILGRRERDVRNEFALPPGLGIACVPEGAVDAPEGESGLAAYFATMLDASLDWSDLEWLVSTTDLPVAVKGVHRADDAERALAAGASAVIVSNHGGRQLDTTPATIDMLPAIAEAVGGDCDVLLDGGVRRGSDVVKALAFGARAVMIGRAYLWGLAAAGQAGVENVLDILSGGIESALRGLAKSSVHDLTADDILVPPGFTRGLGERTT